MKILNLLFILSCLLLCSVGFAQSDNSNSMSATSQGNILVGGSSSFNFTSQQPKSKTDSGGVIDGSTTTSTFSFSPSAGYFVVDNLVLGAGILFSSSKFKVDEFDFEETDNSIVFSPFARYYFTEGNIKPFLQGSVGVGSSKSESSDSDFEFKNSIFAYGFDGGVAFFLGNYVSIDLGLGYAYASFKPKDNNDDNFKSISSGFGFNAGFNIFF